MNHKRVERIWRCEVLRVPKKQPKRGRLWLGDSSLIRLRPEKANHVWAYDFVACWTHSGKPIRLLTVIDEWSRECLAQASKLAFGTNIATGTTIWSRSVKIANSILGN